MSRWLFLPNSAQKDLEVLARLSGDQFRSLKEILNAEAGKRRYEVNLQIAEALGITDEDAAGLSSLWRYIQEERFESGKAGADVVDEFSAVLQAKSSRPLSPNQAERIRETAAAIREKRIQLGELFGDYPERDKARKVEGLSLGPLPHFVNIKTICDLRPIYDDDATTIDKYAAIITLRLVSHGNYDEYNDISINLTEEDIMEIDEEIQRLRKKLALLKKNFPGLETRKLKTKKRR